MSALGALSIHEAAAEAPGREAVIAGPLELRFDELAARVGGAQALLRTRGLEPGTRVAVVPGLSLESLIGLSALLEEGLVPCLLHPRWPDAARAEAAGRVGAALALDVAALGEAPPAPAPPPGDERSPEADLAVLFTSGSSGSPKGVRLSRRAFEASAAGSERNLGWRDEDRWLLNLPLAHIGGLSILTRTRLGRRAVVLPEPRAPAGFDGPHFVAELERRRVTLASLVPTMLARVLRAGLAPPRSLRALLLGGAPAPRALLTEADRRGWPVLTTYGLTEACSQVTVQPAGTRPDAREGAGRALPGVVELDVVDGRIRLRGPMLASGYLPAEGPFLDAGGWLETGDLGRLDDRGRLFVEGRLDELVISGGENVAPGRVEDALRDLPDVEDAVVYGLPDPEWGEVVAATVVPSEGAERAELGAEALARRLTGRLANFERPRRVCLVDALPLSPNGKTDRPKVREEGLRRCGKC